MFFKTNIFREFHNWQQKEVASTKRTATIQELQCGTSYTLYLVATNDFGDSERSEMVTAKTGGLPPSPPLASNLLAPNSSWVGLYLPSWDTGGCDISSFVVEYQAIGHPTWNLVSNNVKPRASGLFMINDLQSGTRYVLKMTAHNSAGSTVATFPFSTLDSGRSPAYIIRALILYYLEGALPSSMVDSSSPLVHWSILTPLLLLCGLSLLGLGLASRILLARLLAPKLQTPHSPSLLPPPPPALIR